MHAFCSIVDDFVVDSGRVLPLPLNCTGVEESLEECRPASVNCNHQYMDGADVIAIRCNATVSRGY